MLFQALNKIGSKYQIWKPAHSPREFVINKGVFFFRKKVLTRQFLRYWPRGHGKVSPPSDKEENDRNKVTSRSSNHNLYIAGEVWSPL